VGSNAGGNSQPGPGPWNHGELNGLLAVNTRKKWGKRDGRGDRTRTMKELLEGVTKKGNLVIAISGNRRSPPNIDAQEAKTAKKKTEKAMGAA